jgi:pimeloyl-ACP methyl ester carboxylesterase
MNRRSMLRRFRNGGDIGSYTGVSFEITGHTELGREKIFFETDIHYIDLGDGEPVLLVHGIGQSLYTWRRNLDAFVSEGYRVIALDLAGFGYSGHPNIYYTAEEYAIILKAFMDSLNLKKANIVAFSTGCASAVCFAAAYPKRVDKLVLISPGAPNPNYPFSMKLLSTWLGAAFFKLYFSESSLRNALQNAYFDTTMMTKDVVEGYYAPYRSRDVRETLISCMKHFDDEYALSLLKSIKSETLVFSGTEDRLHDLQEVRAYAAGIPDSKHIRIRNCGHLLHEEKYAKFNAEALKFLKTEAEAEAETVSRRYQRELVDY